MRRGEISQPHLFSSGFHLFNFPSNKPHELHPILAAMNTPISTRPVARYCQTRYFQLIALLVCFVVLLAIINAVTPAPKLPTFIAENTSKFSHPFTSKQKPTSDMMPLDEAEHYCLTRRWKPYPKRDQKRKVFDLFMINTELDWMEIRMGELAEQVDYFVVLEAETDFTNRPKPLLVQENMAQFSQFQDKIIHHILNVTTNPYKDPWDREHFTRNAMMEQVFPTLKGDQAVNEGDVVIVSDVDEIPRADIVQALRNCDFPRRITLRTLYYRYSFQWLLREPQWIHPQATFYVGPDTIKPDDLRLGKVDDEVFNAGWHCSSCLARLDDMVNKVTSFSHQEFNTPEFTNSSKILQRVRDGLDPYNRTGKTYDRIDNNPDVPVYLLKHPDQFAYLLDRDPPDANFKDLKGSSSR